MIHTINLGKNKYIKDLPYTSVDENGNTIVTFESSDLYTEYNDCKIKKGDIVRINKAGDRYKYSSLDDAFDVTREDVDSDVNENCCAYVKDVVFNNVNGRVTVILKSKGRTYIYSPDNLSVVLKLGDKFLNYNPSIEQFCVETYNGISDGGNILSSAKNNNTIGVFVCTRAVPLSEFDFKKTNEENLKNIIEWC